MPAVRDCVLLVDSDPILCLVNTLALADIGLQVADPPAHADLVAAAKAHRAKAVIANLASLPSLGVGPDHLGRLRQDHRTRDLPLVILATPDQPRPEHVPPWPDPDWIVEPYDVAALRDTLAYALGMVEAISASPPTAEPSPESLPVLLDTLRVNASLLCHRALGEIRRNVAPAGRPARHRVADLRRALDVSLLGARGGWPPARVFATPRVRRLIEHQVARRIEQGIEPALVIQEYQQLRAQVDRYLYGLAARSRITLREAAEAAQRVGSYLDELIRLVVREYWQLRPQVQG